MAENRSKPDQFLLRLPEGMREQLKEAAENNGRSLNTEIVQRLEETLEVNEAGGANAFLMGELAGNVAASMAGLQSTIEGLGQQIASLSEDNKFLRDEVSALYKQLPKAGS